MMLNNQIIHNICYSDIKVEFEASIFKEFGPQSNSKCFTNDKRQEYIDKLLAADISKDLPKQIRGFALGSENLVWEQSEWKFRAKSGEKVHLWTKKTFSSSAKNLGIIRRIVVLEEFFELIKSLHERPTKDGYNGQKKLFNMIKNRYACLPRDAVDKYITLWRRKATNNSSTTSPIQQLTTTTNTTPLKPPSLPSLLPPLDTTISTTTIGTITSASASASSYQHLNHNNNNSTSLLFLQQNGLLSNSQLSNYSSLSNNSSSFASASNNNNTTNNNNNNNLVLPIASTSTTMLMNSSCIIDATIAAAVAAAAAASAGDSSVSASLNSSAVTSSASSSSLPLPASIDSDNIHNTQLHNTTNSSSNNNNSEDNCNSNSISQINVGHNGNETSKATICHYSTNSVSHHSNKFSGISMVYQPPQPYSTYNSKLNTNDSLASIKQSTPSPINNTFLNSDQFATKENSLKENNCDSEDVVPVKRIKLEDGDSDTNTENEEENISPGQPDNNNTTKINGIKKPTDVDMAYNLFVRRIVDHTLDRTVTFCEQPKHIITGLETVCSDAFPSFDKSRHRIKIRGYLKACRRNSKKHNGKVSMKDTPSHMCSEKAYLLANEAMTRVEQEVEKLKNANPLSEASSEANSLKTSNISIAPLINSTLCKNLNYSDKIILDNQSNNHYLDYMESALISSHLDPSSSTPLVPSAIPGSGLLTNCIPSVVPSTLLNGYPNHAISLSESPMTTAVTSGIVPNHNLSWGIPTPNLDNLPSLLFGGLLPTLPPTNQNSNFLAPLTTMCQMENVANKPPPAHSHNHLFLTTLFNSLNSGCGIYPATSFMLDKMMYCSSVDPDLGLQLLANRSSSQEAINFMRIAARYLLSRSLMFESYLVNETAKFDGYPNVPIPSSIDEQQQQSQHQQPN